MTGAAVGSIGVFDSGLGGLTVLQALDDLLPHEDLRYLGDTARYPYGPRPAAQLVAFCDEIADHLLERGASMLVIACNSASAAALEHLRARLDVPVVGVVEPGVRAAVSATATGRVAVIGTQQTVRSRTYEVAAARLRTGLEIVTRACPELVVLVEDGRTTGAHARAVVTAALDGLLDDGVDTLVLGCTHFPLLGRVLKDVVGRGVTLVSSADETAFEVRDLLQRTGLGADPARRGRRRFSTSGDPARFGALGAGFLGRPLGPVEVWEPGRAA